jgi:NitT/TauT family transport system substrate-binding protein
VLVPRPLTALAALAVLVTACSGTGASATPDTSTPPSQGTEPSASVAPVEPVALTVGLGFIPNVQFAPFYLADQAGYYAEAGLDVEFQNKIDPDLITLVGQGSVDIGLADGTSVIPAVSQGIPIRYAAAIYGRFPSIVFAKASSGIDAPADLAGKRLGIPGRYGSSWIMLQALLESAGLTPDDLEIVEYPDFGQGAAVIADAVDASTGFVNNEPVQLERTGEPASILRVDDIVPLPGNGLIAGVETIEAKEAAIATFIAVTLRAMEEIEADPQVGVDAAITAVPELASAPELQLAVLEATIETWRGPVQEAQGLGATDPADWEASIAYLTELGLVAEPVTVEDLLATGLIPGLR